ncbi:MAG: glutamate 5-kinase [Oceanospirillaceae bacterium]|nr:glutamate 5-kinase [Oceanospirillaceae bacterium]
MVSDRAVLKKSRRWVVKFGSALLTDDGKGLDHAAIGRWVDQLVALKQQGIEVVLVSSGAIAEGMTRLGWTKRPAHVHKLQAAAAIGQMGLAQVYEQSFQRHATATAQILLTHDDLSDRKRYLNARGTLCTLLELGVVPVVNENDTVITDEIKFGDNDTLAALVANLVEAEVVILLTDQLGLYTADPRHDASATLISQAKADDPMIVAVAGDGGVLGRGGMATKVRAAKLAARSGAVTVIASGRVENVLLDLRSGVELGTLILPSASPVAARKQWLAGHLQVKGTLVVDEGAATAMRERGKSLLPAGVLSVEGEFSRGEMVLVVNVAGEELARGLVSYSAVNARAIIGLPSSKIESVIGFVNEDELVHRDNLALN